MRALRILLVTAVILGGLFVAADRLAVHFAEKKVAERIRGTQQLAGNPEVEIKGFPFLTQVADRELDEVDIDLDGMTASAAGRSLRISELTAVMHRVQLSSDYSSGTAQEVTGSARLGYKDLSRAAEDGVSVAYGGKDDAGKPQVKVTASVNVPVVGTVKRSVVSRVSVTGGDTVRLRADAVPGENIPGLERLVRSRIDFGRQIAGLPQGVRLDKVVATPKGIDITVTGTKVRLGG
ncbi:LmeA family phospholipid-binding protein [Streptomyces meridianus]|uniref:DUF2993 domain-containing protein n=1 Tax=Streptomyces meridianus TaxID=2938945 RepID=A0ABT0X428_9ACTN|nr:DUF2993 domain-containing protein [Streptomyces meridianus]MCM2577301.1 DUF2993 domain-containing protein [Streptomyces meridianus]